MTGSWVLGTGYWILDTGTPSPCPPIRAEGPIFRAISASLSSAGQCHLRIFALAAASSTTVASWPRQRIIAESTVGHMRKILFPNPKLPLLNR